MQIVSGIGIGIDTRGQGLLRVTRAYLGLLRVLQGYEYIISNRANQGYDVLTQTAGTEITEFCPENLEGED